MAATAVKRLAAGQMAGRAQPLPSFVELVHNARPATDSGRHSPADLSGRRTQLLHEVLTFFKTALRWAARFNGTPQGRTEKRTAAATPKQGVDESQNRATMCGSLGGFEGLGMRR